MKLNPQCRPEYRSVFTTDTCHAVEKLQLNGGKTAKKGNCKKKKKKRKALTTKKKSAASVYLLFRRWLTVACVLAVMPEAQPPLSGINTYADRENMDCQLHSSALTAAFGQFHFISLPLVVVCFQVVQERHRKKTSKAAISIMAAFVSVII